MIFYFLDDGCYIIVMYRGIIMDIVDNILRDIKTNIFHSILLSLRS